MPAAQKWENKFVILEEPLRINYKLRKEECETPEEHDSDKDNF